MPIGQLYLDGADANRNFPHPAPAASDMASVGGAQNQAATVVLPANSSSPNYIGSVEWSYSATPTTGNLKIAAQVGGTLRDLDITVSGFNQVLFSPPLDCGTSQTVTITLAAGGAAVTGKVATVAWQLK